MGGFLLAMLLIALFLGGSFAVSYRLLKRQSEREESLDPRRLKKYDDEDEDDDWPK